MIKITCNSTLFFYSNRNDQINVPTFQGFHIPTMLQTVCEWQLESFAEHYH